MNVLYLTNKPIFPLIDGGCVAMHQLLKCLLHAGYNVKNFTISTQKHPFDLNKFPHKLKQIIQPENFQIDTTVTPLKAVLSLFKSSSFNIDRFYSIEFEKIIIDYVNQNEIELIVFESIFFAKYIPQIKLKCNTKIILRSHNVEFEIWEKLASNEKNILKKLYLKKLAKNLKQIELKTIPLFDGVLCISKNDRVKFQDYIKTVNFATLPIALEEEKHKSDYSVQRFFHLGSMNWKPNLESVKWLVDSIFPKIRKEIPSATLVLAGSNMPSFIKSDANKGIEVVGYVKDVSEFMSNNGIMIVPLKSGSGVRVKILEGMNLGIPILTTTQGAEGIQTNINSDSNTIRIENNEDSIVKAAVELYQSEEKRKTLGQNGLTLIHSKYQIEAVTKKLIEFIKHIS